ncbi:hypothetical protein BGX29_007391 [Mortierella sp. GBA35]|nr:hypothetical protein BGX29_007391 [Mortierella sp. GBA35]
MWSWRELFPAVAIESAAEESNHDQIADTEGDIKAIVKRFIKQTRELFAEDQENIYSTPTEDQLRRNSWRRKKAKTGSVIAPAPTSATDVDSSAEKILDNLPKNAATGSTALVMHKPTIYNLFPDTSGGGSSLVRRPDAKAIRPEWHAP